MENIKDLVELLTLEPLAKNIFLGQNYQAPWGSVFGGQVLGQSLHAAYQTIPKDRIAHSMHGYFILRGNLDIPIRYEVDTIRNGGSFTTRRVVALQNDKPIFNMAASFQLKQDGVDHQITMPNLLPADKLWSSSEQIEEIKASHPEAYKYLKFTLPKVFEFRPIHKMTLKYLKNSEPINDIWMRTTEKMVSDLPLQHQLLAYASDYSLLTTATMPHRETLNKGKTFYASLDHALWFHREFDIHDWLLYAMESPSASNSRGFSRGSIFNKNGVLVASVAQEGLMRQQ